MKNKNGFTLIETLAVIVLLGVILSIAIPSINNAMDSANKKRIKEDAEMLIILAQEYVDSNTDYTCSDECSIDICNKDSNSQCLDGTKLSDTYTSGKVTINACEFDDNNKYKCVYTVELENSKYNASGESGGIEVEKNQ